MCTARDVQSRLQIVALSAAMVAILELATRLARQSPTIPILILGPTGTGKTLIARYIHEVWRQTLNDTEQEGNFAALNCAEMKGEMFTSHVAGHERGAFTGAYQARKGALRYAGKGGTVFLDELAELDSESQAQALKIIEERKATPLGADKAYDVHPRIIVATNADLEAMVREGTFRSDLWYRISALKIEMPSLSERPEDFPGLVKKFLRYEATHSHWQIDPDAVEWLARQRYSGGLRQLRNAIVRARVEAETLGTAPIVSHAAARVGYLDVSPVDDTRGLEDHHPPQGLSPAGVAMTLSRRHPDGWTRQDFIKALGKKAGSQRTRRRRLDELVEEGLVEATGHTSARRFVLGQNSGQTQAIGPRVAQDMAQVEQEDPTPLTLEEKKSPASSDDPRGGQMAAHDHPTHDRSWSADCSPLQEDPWTTS